MSSTSPFEFSCRLMAFSHLPFLRIRMEDGFILSANPAFENTFHHPFHRSLWDLLPSGAAGLLSGQWAALPDDDAAAALGQAAGAAAALAARLKITVRSLDIHKLQKELLEQDVWLGGEKRLKELGLLAEAGEPAGNGEIGEEKNEGKTDICV